MKRSMKIRRFAAILLIPAMLCLAGCRSQKSLEELEGGSAPAAVAAEPNALERQGLAWARFLTAPLCLISFSYAECEKTPASFFIFPFVCAWTIPAGAIATVENIVIGALEILTWQQCVNVEYPWQTFDPKAPHPLNDVARQAFENTILENSGGCDDGSCGTYVPPPSYSYGGHEGRSHGHRSSGGGREARSGGRRSSGGGSEASSGGRSRSRSSSGGRRSGGGHRSHSRGGRSSHHRRK